VNQKFNKKIEENQSFLNMALYPNDNWFFRLQNALLPSVHVLIERVLESPDLLSTAATV